jgi:hypothetical protein
MSKINKRLITLTHVLLPKDKNQNETIDFIKSIDLHLLYYVTIANIVHAPKF